jgi:hypothetical protein
MTQIALVTGANGFAGPHMVSASVSDRLAHQLSPMNCPEHDALRMPATVKRLPMPGCLARALEIRWPAYKGLHHCPEAVFGLNLRPPSCIL